ncbi:MAG: hypothetical protein HYY18_06315 [Planctomycetes bacterium]|nr:hypothetical protein [Planctomycetota bacterium]
MQSAAELFAAVRAHPGMYLMNSTFGEAVAFVDGFDIARKGRPLKGFKEWLVSRLGYGTNLHWAGLVLSLTYPDEPDPKLAASKSRQAQNKALDSLFSLVDEFLSTRTRRQ